MLNLAFIPLSHFFHPVLVAAAFLKITKESFGCEISESIAGHPWYLFVDSGLDDKELNTVSELLSDEISFIHKLLAQP